MEKTKLNNQGSGTRPLAPNKNSKRSKRRVTRKFVSLEVSSRKHRRAGKRMYKNPSGDGAYMQVGKNDYHA